MRTVIGWTIAIVVAVSACADTGVETVDAGPSGSAAATSDTRATVAVGTTAITQPETAPTEPVEAPDATAAPGASPSDGDVDELLAELTADGFCDPDDVEATGDVGTTTAMHFVVDGVPRPPCHGTADDRLDEAWTELDELTPVEYLDDISLLAGYEACEGCDTLAFVTALDEAGAFFLLAIDVTAAQDDPDELRLTLMHELSHVVTQDPTSQLDVDVGADTCTTYHNGNGCLTDTSYLWAWMSRFWEPDVLATFEFGEADEAGGEQRCDLGGDFTGPYGASSPEEDFAEVFAAYVFDVEFDGRLDEKLAFFHEYPEFRGFRERAATLGLDGLGNTFEGCS